MFIFWKDVYSVIVVLHFLSFIILAFMVFRGTVHLMFWKLDPTLGQYLSTSVILCMLSDLFVSHGFRCQVKPKICAPNHWCLLVLDILYMDNFCLLHCIWAGFSPGNLVFPLCPEMCWRLIVISRLSIVCVCVCAVVPCDRLWHPVQSVPCLVLQNSWDRPQIPCDPVR